MPQLDFSTFPTQWIWLAITFIAMYVIMAKTALPRIGQVLEERQDRIDGNLEMAAQLKQEAEEAADTYEQGLTEARAESQTIIRQVTDELSADSAKHLSALGDDLAGKVADAEKGIAKAREAALGNVRELAAEIAKEAAGKLAGLKPTDAKLGKAIDAAMQERS